MFEDQDAPPPDPVAEAVAKLTNDIDEIKRYAAGTYSAVDTEVGEIKAIVQKIEQKLNETDRQVDKIEQFERALSEIKASVRNMERKIK